MSTFQDFVKLGQEIGLDGRELLDFAKEREAAERDERAEARALEKARLEAQEKASEDAKEVELARIAAGKETNQRELDLEKAKLQWVADGGHDDVTVSNIRKAMSSDKPKLPAFDMRRDNIDAYLARFERYAESQKWPECEWSVSLSALLTGRALDTYCRLSPKDANCYKTLKLALLKAFECTEEGFRQRFRGSRLESGETYPQFGARLEHMFTRWVELSGSYMTFDGLKDLLLREQLMMVSNRDLVMFVKERQASNFEEMLKLAEAFREARPRQSKKLDEESSNQLYSTPSQESEVTTPQIQQRTEFTRLRQIRCHRCKQMGHIARECTQKTRRGYPQEASCLYAERQSEMAEYLSVSERMPIAEGIVLGKTVTVLRDSGCSGVVVKRCLVPDEAWTGESQECVLLDGTVHSMPIAQLRVDTPYYTGIVRAMTMENPIYDVVIGNIAGARGPDDPLKDWKFPSCEMANAVETRGQRLRASKPFTPLSTSDCPASNASPAEISRAQKEDPTFELLYGRTVRGPVSILKELWTKETPDTDVRSTYQYVLELRNRLEDTCRLARETLSKNSQRYKKNFDKKTRKRSFVKGDKVLVLLPTDRNKLLMQWRGPYVVQEKVGINDYRLQLPRELKLFHANLLRKYVEREQEVKDTCVASETCATAVSVVSINDSDDLPSKTDIELPALKKHETYTDAQVSAELDEDQVVQVQSVMKEFTEVLTDVPGRTNIIEHDINLLDANPIHQRMYPVPYAMRETIIDEVKTMLELDVIEKSKSPYSSPIVIVKKKDGTNRFCIDYRRLNSVTEFDAEPTPNVDDLYAEIGRGNYAYFSKLDLSKGYWQIPMTEKAKPMTAFQTPLGLFQWKMMPFGLMNSAATFTRMMRILLQDMKPGVMNYIDDILVCSKTWGEHLVILRDVLLQLKGANLTAKPSKCLMGYCTLEFLGHNVGEGKLSPEQGKVSKILSIRNPRTKKEVRSLLGLISYYRKFIPNFAAITAPLTDLTKNGKPNQVVWDEPCEKALSSVKQRLATSPVLRLPDFTKEFIVRTDASDEGLGAVLLQQHEGQMFPVMYASRKLQPREKCYATTEKECLAIVWAIQKFQRYLYGKEFALETDHEALTFLKKSKMTNQRVMRWALCLQQYSFTIRAIKGKDNIGADLLSRCCQ